MALAIGVWVTEHPAEAASYAGGASTRCCPVPQECCGHTEYQLQRQTVLQNVQETVYETQQVHVRPRTSARRSCSRGRSHCMQTVVEQCVRDGAVHGPAAGAIARSTRECHYTVQRPVTRTSGRTCTYTVCRPVRETHMETRPYTVCRPVRETSLQDLRRTTSAAGPRGHPTRSRYTVCRPVQETIIKTVSYTVCRPVQETCYKTCVYTVCRPGAEDVLPVGALHGPGAGAADGDAVPADTEMVPVQQCAYKQVPYTVCRQVRETVLKECRYTVCRPGAADRDADLHLHGLPAGARDDHAGVPLHGLPAGADDLMQDGHRDVLPDRHRDGLPRGLRDGLRAAGP